MAGTLAEKVWDAHVVRTGTDGAPDLLYIDLHLVHEVTSPQAFDGLRLAGRPVRRPDLTIATEDHNIPTLDIDQPIADLDEPHPDRHAARATATEFGVRLHSLGDADQGIVHVVGPQLGLTQPGMTVVCGDSHTSTHGAFGALAFGIGTSEVEHVLATQTLPLRAVQDHGDHRRRRRCPPGVTGKDIILAVIAKIGTGGGQGYVLEYRGEAIETLSMEARMTICNMSIEAGARAGMIAPGRDHLRVPQGPPARARGRRLGRRRRVLADAAHRRRRRVRRRGRPRRRRPRARSSPGAPTPARACRSAATVPDPSDIADENERVAAERALDVHGPDARHAAARDRGRHRLRRLVHQRPHRGPARGRRRPRGPDQVADGVRDAGRARARCGCGCRPRPRASTRSSLDFGAEWRNAGCSMCLGMNPDQLAPGGALRVDVEPQLRGPPGQGRPHPPRVARSSPPPPRSAARCSRPGRPRSRTHAVEEAIDHGEVHHPHRHRRAAAPQQRRHRPDHPRRLPQARHPHRLRGRPVRGLAQRPGLRPQPARRTARARSSSPVPTSAPAPRASTPSGR